MDGALAQLIERSIRIAEVAGLIPARSTKYKKHENTSRDVFFDELLFMVDYVIITDVICVYLFLSSIAITGLVYT